MPFDLHAAAQVAVIAAVTLLLRFLPFAVFGGGRPTPRYILYLANVLPCAIMAMLVVYCYRNVKITSVVFGAPEFICALVILVLHRWKHNLILSIAAGTLLYMALVQTVF